MSVRLGNADLILILMLALGCALLLALRFRPQTWRGIVATPPSPAVASCYALSVALLYSISCLPHPPVRLVR
ncbi:hypothetical protein G3N57_07920, partial [Paraburkholderia sp. Se-20369]|nr:hypothetical protein [Paraburkholderia sp. Se-20369]